jgi:hypothetical protein
MRLRDHDEDLHRLRVAAQAIVQRLPFEQLVHEFSERGSRQRNRDELGRRGTVVDDSHACVPSQQVEHARERHGARLDAHVAGGRLHGQLRPEGASQDPREGREAR